MFSLQSLDLSDISDFNDIISASSQSTKSDSTLSSLGRSSEILEDIHNKHGIALDETIYSGNKRVLIQVDPPDDPFEVDHTRSFYKGTSVRFGGVWQEGVHYINDEYIIDFVIYADALLICKKSNFSSSENEPIIIRAEDNTAIGVESNFWTFVCPGLFGTFVKNPSMTVWTIDRNGIPSG